MTSPAQLKYLNAIGIPVWVSRDLIIESETIQIASTSTTSSERVKASSVQSLEKPSNNPTQNSSALSILSALDAKQDLTSRDTNQDVNSRDSNQDVNSSDSNQAIESHSNDRAIQDNSPRLEQTVKETLVKTQITNDLRETPKTEVVNSINLLSETDSHYIYASGSEEANWMVIGHSPEPFNGIGQEPFASESGELLNNMLRAVGINDPRSQSYLINVIDINKSKQDSPESQKHLKDKLFSIIEQVKPKIILLVGQNAAQNILSLDDPLIIMRSKVHHIAESKIPCVVTYYPSYLLQKTTDKRKAWNDLKLAMSQLD